MSEETLDAQAVIDKLNELDEDEVGRPEPKPAPAPVSKPEPAPEPVKPAVRGQDDPALAVAWSLVEDHVAETCPDLDEEMRSVIRDASNGNPLKFKEIAKKMQAKVTAKKSDSMSDQEQLKKDITEKVFDGGGQGGDSAVAKVKQPTAEDKMKAAVAKGDSRGILQSVAQNINDKKLFERGVEIIVD